MINNLLQRSDNNRAKAREEAHDRVRAWYLAARGIDVFDESYAKSKPIEVVECDTVDPLTGQYEWWLEPLVKGVPNVKTVEKHLGNSAWSIENVQFDPPIISYGGM